MKGADVIQELLAAGWILDRARGSHRVFKHSDLRGHVVVPHPKRDLGVGLIAAIRKQAAFRSPNESLAKRAHSRVGERNALPHRD